MGEVSHYAARQKYFAAVAAALLTLGACAGTTSGNDGGLGPVDGGSPSDAGLAMPDAGQDGLTDEQRALLLARPYRKVVSNKYDGGSEVPLLLLLHGYGGSGVIQDAYFNASALAQSQNFILAAPDGTLDSTNRRFWNVTDACCDWFKVGVDDVKYLSAIIDELRFGYRIDPKRIWVVGHSNGGFMAHRMGCDRADKIAGIVSLAGAQNNDASKCQPSAPVAALQVHGSADTVVLYDGGFLQLAGTGGPYPSAPTTARIWADQNGCETVRSDAGAAMDVVSDIAGNETRRELFANCDGGASELWTIQGGPHVPTFNITWGPRVLQFLNAHPKP
jgi:polyhydroxybutyrate depolymerase